MSNKPVKEEKQILVRISAKLKKAFDKKNKSEGKTLNGAIRVLIEQDVKAAN